MRATKAILIFVMYVVLFVAGTPGLDFLPTSFMKSKPAQKVFRDKHGDLATLLATAAGDINRTRKPFARTLGSFQPVFRVRQSWHLYRDGPRPIRRMEIHVDDQVVYRTMDPDANWLEPVLRNRRVRPMAESLVKKAKAANRIGLSRFIVERARADYPDAQRIEIRSLTGRRPGKRLRVHHSMVATAPDWDIEDVR